MAINPDPKFRSSDPTFIAQRKALHQAFVDIAGGELGVREEMEIFQTMLMAREAEATKVERERCAKLVEGRIESLLDYEGESALAGHNDCSKATICELQSLITAIRNAQ